MDRLLSLLLLPLLPLLTSPSPIVLEVGLGSFIEPLGSFIEPVLTLTLSAH